MAFKIRPYEARDFQAIHRLDQACFPPGISYSKWSMQYFVNLATADCLVAEDEKKIVGFLLAETNPPLAHIITLDVAESHRKRGVGSPPAGNRGAFRVPWDPIGTAGNGSEQ